MSKSLGQIACKAVGLPWRAMTPHEKETWNKGAAVRDAVLAENKAEVDSVKHAATSWAEAANKWAAEYDRVFDELQLLKAEVASLRRALAEAQTAIDEVIQLKSHEFDTPMDVLMFAGTTFKPILAAIDAALAGEGS